MNEQEKQAYLEKYHRIKEKGIPFFPDIVFKDAVIALVVFLVLVALAYFVGAPLEARANPADSTYTPRPEWYFLFLFQLLKYFPGDLEVIGVVLLPTLAIVLLFLLPFIDRGPRRHFTARPVITLITLLLGGGIIFLTIQAFMEAPPPAEASTGGDPTAVLYADNCAGCHGPTINVSAGTNLHDVIAQGSHEGMPAWNADLTSDEIDALAGFILSPGGSVLFSKNCGDCHEVLDLVASDPIQLRNALDQGTSFEGHTGVEVPEWSEVLSREERTSLLNFLVAPDGQRLFTTNCSSCHGRSVAFDGSEEELRTIITEGGLHLEMPPWQEKLSASELDQLAQYVVDPQSDSSAADLFEQHCTRCHGQRIPTAKDVAEARNIIATGGSHETMPVWGDILTSEQIDALVAYTL
ncbi:MAG: c-type cytochrome, partial [Anaerolineae bacterium]